ncbi:MAG: SDR family oxidoreductase, partial [Pseudomonadota bacterium]
MNHLFCFGLGKSARTLGRLVLAEGWTVTGTSRSEEGCERLRADGFDAVVFDGETPMADIGTVLGRVSHLLISAPPGPDGDPVLRMHGPDIAAAASHFAWAGYLSTTGVYGDRQGGWVDEDSELLPATERGRRRVEAETGWRAVEGLPLHIFRLAGIYGPGSNQLVSLLNGKSRRVIKPGQVFSRIHVDDIAAVLRASMARPDPGRAYNVCDDEAAPPQDVVAHAAELLGMEPPPEVPFEDAGMSPMGRSFYAESKRVRNDRIKQELGV